MNTTNNKTSLYDSVKKNDKKNIVGEINKGRLDSVPRGNYITILDKFGEVVAFFIHSGRVVGSGFINPIIAYYPGTGWLKECPSFKLDEIDTIRFATQTEIEILLKNMVKEGYIWDGWQVIKDNSAEEKKVEIENDNKINLKKLKMLSKGEILTVYNTLGQIEDILIYDCMMDEYGLFNTVLAYSPITGILRDSPVLDFDKLTILAFATPEEKTNLLKIMREKGYQYNWWGWDSDDEESDEDKQDESPSEEETIVPSVEKKCILDKAIENKIWHNIKIANDIIGNTLPYYAIGENIERIIRTPKNSLQEDLHNFNYFTNKEDVDEAIRRVKGTLMNFQEEIQNRKK